MTWHTPYAHLTDSELLYMVDGARSKSPIIEELAQRLENKDKIEEREPDITDKVSCPLCLGTLHAELQGNDLILKG